MFQLKDFVHLPQLIPWIERMVAEATGLILVTGLDARPQYAHELDIFLPSGRSTILSILASEVLKADAAARALLVAADRTAWRVPRAFQGRVRTLPVGPNHGYADRLAEARYSRPDLLVLDRLPLDLAADVLGLAREGQRVLTQFDTVLRGADVLRQLLELGVSRECLEGLSAVLYVQRLPLLCTHCKQAAPPAPEQLQRLGQLYPHLDEPIGALLQPAQGRPSAPLYQARGCPRCQHSGRSGDIAAFDLFRPDPGGGDPLQQSSELALESYMLHLVAQGRLDLQDVLRLERDQLRRTYNMLQASERSQAAAALELQSRSIELAAANRVLQQRTEAILSIHDVGQALVQVTDIRGLARRICHHSCKLGGADRAVLYLLRPDRPAEVLAASGWDEERLPRYLSEGQMAPALAGLGEEAQPYRQWPPGIPPRHPDLEGAHLQAGLRVPLVAQGERVGLMVVHATWKRHFMPGEVALLQTFANQAAIAVENARLFEDLERSLQEIGEMKGYMEDILASVDSAILTTDKSGVVMSCNRAAEAIWQLPEADIRGQSIDELFDRRRGEELLALFQEALEREMRFHDYELNCTLSRRGQVTLKLQITPLKDAQSQQIGMTVVVEDLTEERHLRQTLNRYLAPSVVQEALRMATTGHFSLGGTHRVMSVLFADIRGFTAYSERVDPTRLVDVLNWHLTVAARAILEQGGTLDKFMGDGVMALFNVPVPQQDHALRAVRAAWEMQQRLALMEPAPPEILRFGVGVHVGEAVAGNIGSPERLDYTAVGDTVNLARRLEEQAVGGQILLSEAAYQAVAPWVQVYGRGLLNVKGREEPVRVYELRGVGP
ncbi:MAG: GAF domain-containing protein [Chloroflexia bacterium]|nr:GAF domain-containing protein [Chloroflexia bacterium]